jgi:hypothetical protein
MQGIIDRFEGDYAVVEMEDRTMKDILRSQVSTDATEGDIIVLVGNVYVVDKGATELRKAEVKKLSDSIWE